MFSFVSDLSAVLKGSQYLCYLDKMGEDSSSCLFLVGIQDFSHHPKADLRRVKCVIITASIILYMKKKLVTLHTLTSVSDILYTQLKLPTKGW